MAVPFRLRQQQQLQQKLDTTFKESLKESIRAIPNEPVTESPRSYQSDPNFFDNLNEAYADSDSSSTHSRSSTRSTGTRELAARLDKLISRQPQASLPEATYGTVSKEEAQRLRTLDPLDYEDAKRQVVVKKLTGEMNGSVTIVPVSKSLDDIKFVKNEPPKVVQNTPNIQSFTNVMTPPISPEKLPRRPEKDSRRSPVQSVSGIPIPPRNMAFADKSVYHARAFSEDDKKLHNLPYPPPLRKSSFDKATTMKYINRPVPPLVQNQNQQLPQQLPPQQQQQQQQYIPPNLHQRPPYIMQNNQNNQNMRPQMPPKTPPTPSQPLQPNPPVIEQYRRDDNTMQFRPPVMPYQQPPQPLPSSFRSRNDNPPPPPPQFPLFSKHPPSPQSQEKRLYVGQRVTPVTSPVVSPRNSMTSLDKVPPSWPKNDDTIVRKSEESSRSLHDIQEEQQDEEETLKHTSNDERGDEENPREVRHKKKHKSRSRSRSKSRDGSERSDSESGEKKKKRKRRRGGVVISRRMRKFLKFLASVVVLNLVIVDALLIVFFVYRRAF